MQESQIKEPKATWCVKGLGSNSDKYEPGGKQMGVACTLCARDYKGLGNQGGNVVIESSNGVIENENRKA